MADQKEMQMQLNEDMLIPAIRWMAEQVPGGFFVYLADASQRLIYVNNA